MIDLQSGEKIQNVTKEPIVIDTTKNWLIIMGHGRVEIAYPEGKTLLEDRNTVYFICEQGTLKQITNKEFMERNGGKNW
jgi:Trk K+ transport system NAD-binding subunit